MNAKSKSSPSIVHKSQQSAALWIKEHGLYAHDLTLNQILPRIGFKRSEGTYSGKKIVSVYNDGLFVQHPSSDGAVYNITAANTQIKSFERKLEERNELFTARIKWLNSGSCLLLGAITDERVCFIITGIDDNSKEFDCFMAGIQSLLKEQVSQISAFNITRSTLKGLHKYSEDMVEVSPEDIEEAADWVTDAHQSERPLNSAESTPEHNQPLPSAIVEAVVQASAMENVDSITLLVFGSSLVHSYGELKDAISSLSIPISICAFKVTDKQAIEDYQELAQLSNGRFHLYNPPGVNQARPSSSSRPSSSRQSSRPSSGWSSTSSKSSSSLDYLTVPDEEMLAIWRELEESRNIIADLQAIQLEKGVSNPVQDYSPLPHVKDDYVSSVEWLSVYGLKNKKLLYQDLVSSLAFQHCEGVIPSPSHDTGDVEMISQEDKLIGAVYCKGFVHLRWTDGQIIHTHLDKRPYETYKRNVEKVIEELEQRIEWLSKGSRELFGTILEENIVIALDTSSSMARHLFLVKKKLRQLAFEQLVHKARFSLIHFGTEVIPWKDTLVPVTQESISTMLEWVGQIEAEGSTNTLGVLKKAMSIPGVQAIYLITDGRPDQPFETLTQHIQQWRSIPIHVISFNCADTKANKFLAKMAAMTNGRYHYYSECVNDPDGPISHKSEDLRLLQDEVVKAHDQLAKAEQLYNECSRLPHKGQSIQNTSPTITLQRKTSMEMSRKGTITSLSHWIKVNSLVSRNLTVFDALGPASVPHDPTHIDVIDKDVKGKVFEEIMSKAHVSGSGHVRLINPNGIDIRNYTAKLDEYIDECHDTIMKYCIQKLPYNYEKSLRAELGLGVREGPVYDEHFSALHDKVKEAELSEVIEEVEHVQHEVMTAEQYRNQAEALLQDSIRNEDQAKLVEMTDGLLLSPTSSQHSTYHGSSFMRSTSRHLSGSNSKMDKTMKLKRILNKKQVIQRGQRVACLHPDDGLYYPGIYIGTKPGGSGFCEVKLPHQQKVLVLQAHLVPYGSSSPCPALRYGDYVLVRVRVSFGSCRDLFLPGTVCSIPGNPKLSVARYDVTLYGGKLVFGSRSALIKIGVSRYRQICDIMRKKVPLIDDDTVSEGRITSSLVRLSRHGRKEDEVDHAGQKEVPMEDEMGSNKSMSEGGEDSTHNTTATDACNGTEVYGKSTPNETSSTDDFFNETTPDKGGVVTTPSHPTSGHSTVMIDRGTNPMPILVDIGVNTDPIDSVVDQVTTTTDNRPLTSHDDHVTNDNTTETDDLSIGMLGNDPIGRSTPIVEGGDRKGGGTYTPSIGEKVLARWSNDGWYYKGTIVGCIDANTNDGKQQWKIKNDNNFIDMFHRVDFITDHDDGGSSIRINDYVIGLHPSYSRSYAPGQVKEVLEDGFHLVIELYDTTEVTLPRHEVYLVSKEVYEESVKIIIDKEEDWVGRVVIARSNKTGLFHPGTVTEHVKNSQEYRIKWADNTTTVKNARDIFGELTTRRPLHMNDYVIALPMKDPQGICYPGQITGKHENNQVIITLYNKESITTTFEQCFWISEMYYSDLMNRMRLI